MLLHYFIKSRFHSPDHEQAQAEWEVERRSPIHRHQVCTVAVVTPQFVGTVYSRFGSLSQTTSEEPSSFRMNLYSKEVPAWRGMDSVQTGFPLAQLFALIKRALAGSHDPSSGMEPTR